MPDDRTRKPRKPKQGAEAFFSRYQATLVVLAGAAEGTELEIHGERVVLGSGAGADMRFDDPSMSERQAVFETGEEAMWIRRLDGARGFLVNGVEVREAELKQGDRLEIGEQVFEFALDERQPATRIMHSADD